MLVSVSTTRMAQSGVLSAPCKPAPCIKFFVASRRPCVTGFSRIGRGKHLQPRCCLPPKQQAVSVPSDAATVTAQDNVRSELHYLLSLAHGLQAQVGWDAKVSLLRNQPRVSSFLKTEHGKILTMTNLQPHHRAMLLLLVAINQPHVLRAADTMHDQEQLQILAEALVRVERFYNSIGGLAGYQAKCLQLIADHDDPAMATHAALMSAESTDVALEDLLVPAGVSLHGGTGCAIARSAAAKGLHALPAMAEVYPLGGAGDRLGLRCETTGECLPTAMLLYCGRSLLEGLLRDLQAREWLYYKLTGRQVVTPVAIMTSDAKGNHERVVALLEEHDWFGRGRDSFRLFRQPMVPVVCVDDGRWVVEQPLQPMMKPGGHGAIWKLMLDEGVFDFFAQQGREAAIVRQISNPMAGTDNMLLALSGIGHFDGKAFGFASCDRVVGAAEGINVLRHRKVSSVDDQGNQRWEFEYGVTCVEYTEFERLGVPDACADGSKLSRYPANTNILYLGLQAARGAVEAGVRTGGGAALPGMVFNTSKKITYTDIETGEPRTVCAGRLECTMQNLADCFAQRFDQQLPKQLHGDLDTFVVFNTRRKVTSSAKRKRDPGSLKIAQTPDGSFLDLQRNAAELLSLCGVHVPEMCDVPTYLEKGPSFVFLYHPALGPLWSVIAQKIQGGRMEGGSELVLEVADAQVTGLALQGSLLIRAERVLGTAGTLYRTMTTDWDTPTEDRRMVFGNHNGRVRLINCTVINQGIDWEHEDNVYWQHKVVRKGAVDVVLEGRSEFEAINVKFEGSHMFWVPDGYKMVVRNTARGGLAAELLPLGSCPSWEWVYTMAEDGMVRCGIEESRWFSSGQIPLVRLAGEDMGILI